MSEHDDLKRRLGEEQIRLGRQSFDCGNCGLSANVAMEAEDAIERLEHEVRWRSPDETPEKETPGLARRVLVWIVFKNDPRIGTFVFGHRIYWPETPGPWPEDGWFFDGQTDDYRVAAWRYCNPPEGIIANA